jgi:hypothetical protein
MVSFVRLLLSLTSYTSTYNTYKHFTIIVLETFYFMVLEYRYKTIKLL